MLNFFIAFKIASLFFSGVFSSRTIVHFDEFGSIKDLGSVIWACFFIGLTIGVLCFFLQILFLLPLSLQNYKLYRLYLYDENIYSIYSQLRSSNFYLSQIFEQYIYCLRWMKDFGFCETSKNGVRFLLPVILPRKLHSE